ncbi:MAG: pitrilysin family protein [Bryobacteraceae bacterium]
MNGPAFSLVSVLFLAASAVAAEVDIPYTEFTLDNGLRVIVHEDHKAPIVAVNIWYHVGSKNERTGKTGFAHLFEHLMFGGSENVKGRYIDYVERLGATDLNGTTNADRTNYFETVPVAALDRVLFLESDRMGHFYKSINKEVLDLQRGVVQNEKRQGDNQPYSIVYDTMPGVTYPAGHPYSHTVVGSLEDLDAASLADVQNWFKSYYGPNNAVMSIAGDISLAEVKEKATTYFGDIPPSPPVVRPAVWVSKGTAERRFDIQDHVAQPRFYKVWNVPEFASAPADYLQLIAAVLASGKASRLYKRLVYDNHIATDAFAYLNAREIAGQFVVEATVANGHTLADVERALNEELARFLKDGPTDAELERVRTEWTADFVRHLVRVGGFGGKSDVLAHYALFTGDPSAWKRTYARMQNASAADLRETAVTWLADGDCTFSVSPVPERKELAKGVDRSKMPEVAEVQSPHLPKLRRASLSNGLEVILAERHDLPVVNFEVVIDAGYAADALSLPGTAKLTSSVLTDGTAKRTALQISEELQAAGAEIRAFSDLDTTVVQLSALKAKLDASLDLLTDVLLNPAFPEADFERERKLQIAAIDQEKTEPFGVALRVLPPLLYGPRHSYGTPLTGSGTPASMSEIKREDLAKFYRTWFLPNNAKLVIAGDTTIEEIQPKLEKYLATWKRGNAAHKPTTRVAEPEKRVVYLIDKPDAPQTIILTGIVGPPPTPAQEVQLEAMDKVFGGSFGSRLNMNLREDKHWSYGAGTSLMDASGQRPYIAFVPVQTDKTKESMIEVDNEMHGMLGSRPITPDELDRVKKMEVLQLAGSRESLEGLTFWIRKAIELHLPDDYYDRYADRVKALTLGDVKDAAQSVIAPDHTIWLVVGDRAKIEKDVRALNLGEMRLLDANGQPVNPSQTR